VTTTNDLAGSFWPSDRQKLLLSAALLDEERSASAWRRLRPSFDLDTLEPASYALLPLLYQQLDRLGIEDPLLPRLRGIYRHTWYMNQLRLGRLKDALKAVQECDGDPLVVSSWELPARYYGDFGLRAVAALHLLVRPERVGRTARALCEEGWIGPLEPSQSFLRSRPYARFSKTNGDTCVVCWRLFHEFSDPERRLEPEDLWEAAIDFPLGDVAARALSPTDELLDVFVSGARMSRWPTIAWVPDAIAVLRASDSAIDWERLVVQARRLRATLRIRDATTFLRQELDAPVPTDVIEELRDTPVPRRELLAHRAAGARWAFLGPPPEILTRFLRLTANESVPRAVARFPTFLRDEWGLDRRSQVPLMAARKVAARISGARDARRADAGPRPSRKLHPNESANVTE
jgi:hypothetical protein